MYRGLIYYPMVGLMALSLQTLSAHGHEGGGGGHHEEHEEEGRDEGAGNEGSAAQRRNEYEYNLYDRNYDEVRGRGIYEQEDRAYPDQELIR